MSAINFSEFWYSVLSTRVESFVKVVNDLRFADEDFLFDLDKKNA